ncbi:hypothetical protein U1Q18_017466 [Sarracenia purpurea var. burkii]
MEGSDEEIKEIKGWQNKESKLGVRGGEINSTDKWQNRERKLGGSEGETIFIDNLPDKMDPRWLGYIFCKIGDVLYVFILRRRRTSSNTRYGFVTFSSQRGVALAIARFNGFWCMDRRLQVRRARFNTYKGYRMRNSSLIKKRVGTSDHQVRIQMEKRSQHCHNNKMGEDEEPTLQGEVVEAKVIDFKKLSGGDS